jgi:hypothetical protein
VEDELTHLRGLIDRCENLLRRITDDGVMEELERIPAEARSQGVAQRTARTSRLLARAGSFMGEQIPTVGMPGAASISVDAPGTFNAEAIPTRVNIPAMRISRTIDRTLLSGEAGGARLMWKVEFPYQSRFAAGFSA